MSAYVMDKSFTKVDLSNQNSYTQIYNYDGSGEIESIWIRFNSDNVFVRLEIDGVEVFEFDCDDLESNANSFDEDGYELYHDYGQIFWHRGRNAFKFVRKTSFGANVKIEAKANSNSTGRDMLGYIVGIRKRE